MSTSTLGQSHVLPGWTSQQRTATRIGRAILRGAVTTARFAQGLVFFVCGLNGFLDFLPHPTEAMSAGAMQLVGGMVASGYFFPLLKGTEAAAGLLLLTNRFVPLALAVLAPIVINIVAFHAALAPSGAGVAGVVLVLQLFLAWAYRGAYRAMLAAKVSAAA